MPKIINITDLTNPETGKTDPPEVKARLSHDGLYLVIVCPYCGTLHAHGAGKDWRNPAYGHRLAHCGPRFKHINKPGYILIKPKPNPSKTDLLTFMDRLAEFLGNSDGQTTEEIRAELCEEMGEEKFLAAEKRFMEFVEELKGKSNNERQP